MGGGFITEDWESITSDNIRTLVLVGRTGNGKSATGNTILNRTVFESEESMNSITSRCEMQTSVMEDGRTLNVIDTPGLYDSETEKDFNQKEIIKCIDLAKDGIHAVLMVFSIQNRYSNEEENAFKTLMFLFGEKIINYMILVFTCGDALKPRGLSFEKRISQSPKFQKVLDLCEHRVVLFDNETMDVSKRSEQRNKLLSLVELVVKKNDGQPFLDKSLAEVSRGAAILDDQMKDLESPTGDVKPESQSFWDALNKRFAVQKEQFTGILDSRVRETEENLKQLLEEEKKARLKVEEDAKAAKEEADEKIRQLREQLENAEKARGGGCSIL